MLDTLPHAFVANRSVDRIGAYPGRLAGILSADGLAEARREIATWPGYAPTPLVDLPGLGREAGFAAIRYKDEGGRFGLGSFKALGGAYAVGRVLAREIARCTGEQVTPADLRAGRHRDAVAGLTVCTATDGNHGRSVAWGAATYGCRSVIYIHAHVSEGRKQAIERFGAEVRRVPGNYDDSVHQAAADAAANGWFVVSDTSYDGYSDVPRDVMHGYMVMAEEALHQWADAPPTHLFVQGGVGGLAAAVLATAWLRYGADRPVFVVAEPERAACLFESARAGRPVRVEGDLDTMMAGLAAGEVSLIAWDVLAAGADGFMTIPDDGAVAMMRRLAAGGEGDPSVTAGESAVCGLAAAIVARRDPALAGPLRLDGSSRLLVFGSEGATDPELYARIVGRAP